MALVGDALADLHLGPLEPVDLLVDPGQLILVQRPEEASVGELRHLLQHLVVRRVDGLHRDRLAEGVADDLAGAEVELGQHRRLVLPEADRVEADAERRREFGRRHRQDRLAHVVVAVGEQDEDLGILPLQVLHAIERHGHAVADCRARLADDADVHAVDAFADPVAVDGDRAEEVGFAGEDHGADAVVGAFRDEILHDADA